VIFEGTKVSEGRGTTRPFEIFGAPYLEPDRVLREMEVEALDGASLREVHFRPTFNKWNGKTCRGFQLHVTDRRKFRPYRAALAILGAVIKAHPEEFRWSDPPYEYEYDKMPIDVILGNQRIRNHLEAGGSVLELEKEWEGDLDGFIKLRSHFLLYDMP